MAGIVFFPSAIVFIGSPRSTATGIVDSTNYAAMGAGRDYILFIKSEFGRLARLPRTC